MSQVYSKSDLPGVLLYCRPGFEADCARELHLIAETAGVATAPRFEADGGFVYSGPITAEGHSTLRNELSWQNLIFARQVIFGAVYTGSLPAEDRVTPVMDLVKLQVLEYAGTKGFGTVLVDHPDSDPGRELAKFCDSLTRPMGNALKRYELLEKPTPGKRVPKLHLFLMNAGHGFVGFSDLKSSAPWPLGIPRLKFPTGAPSRSILKLEEAFLTFFDRDEISEVLRNGMRAVDLGASPGGWTWYLVKKQLFVTAVDNGAIAPELIATGMVEHVKADAFKYFPRQTVDWLVCDVIEQPSRIAALIGEWLEKGLTRHVVFNLKLPMKNCLQEVQSCLKILSGPLRKHGLKARAKQLYHDRREVTVIVMP